MSTAEARRRAAKAAKVGETGAAAAEAAPDDDDEGGDPMAHPDWRIVAELMGAQARAAEARLTELLTATSQQVTGVIQATEVWVRAARDAPGADRPAPARPARMPDIKGAGQTFNGNREDLAMWVFSTEADFRVLSRQEDADKITYAGTLLRGAALHWMFARSRAAAGLPRTWDAFKEALQEQFGSALEQGRLRQDLFALRQSGTLPAYLDKFQQLFFLVDGMDGETALFAFTQGLAPTIAAEVLRARPVDLDAAMRAARIADDALARAKTFPRAVDTTKTATSVPFKKPWTPAAASGPVGAPVINVHALAATPGGARRPPVTMDQRAELMRAGACFKCRRPGHVAATCPERSITAAMAAVEAAGPGGASGDAPPLPNASRPQ